MGKSKFNNIKLSINGVEYDSRSEYLFHTKHPEFIRNTQRFVVWESSDQKEQILSEPDFVSKDGKRWVEIKSLPTYEEASFKLKLKLIKDYCLNNGIAYAVLVFQNEKFNSPEHFQTLKRLRKKLAKHKKLGDEKKINNTLEEIKQLQLDKIIV